MKSSAWQPPLATLLTTSIICLCLFALSSTPALALAGKITEFAIPTVNSGPYGITAGPDGNLWFTELGGDQIGQLR